ncbi:MAG TPA: PTS sugar transporter subunit IIA [Anaeromyxobacteraceae bacterium]|nr:PTS sugar transporter subunit IIA [Anaeromyxobacteraceae bacterium]
MVGVVVASHGRLAEELLRTAEGIVGRLDRCVAVTIDAQVSMEEARARLQRAIAEVDEGDGTLILTDMFGGTPSNLALTFLESKVEVVTGVNLPMIVKLSTLRAERQALADLAGAIASYGGKNITLASDLLRTRLRP